MSLPLPYGEKPTGVERPPPARASPRPYAERLRGVDALVERAGPSRNTVVSALPGASAVLMILGALAPIAYAHPDIRAALFEPLASATYPFSAGLTFVSDAVWAGWQGALLLCAAAVLGFAAWRVNAGRAGAPASRNEKLLSAAVFTLLAAAIAVAVLGLSQGDMAQSGAAAWVLITGVGGGYGAWQAQSRRDFQGSVTGAVALILGGRFLFGGIALLMLALSDKEFPGQRVAPYSWSHSQVAMEPVRPRPAPEYKEEDWEALHRARWTWHSAPPLVGFLLLIGGFAPFGYWEPFRVAFFGPLVSALQPLTTFVPIVSDAFWSLNPVFVVYIVISSLVAIAGARFAFASRRPGAVAAGAVALLVSGRVITAVAVLVILLFTYDQYGDGRESPEGAHGAEAGTASH